MTDTFRREITIGDIIVRIGEWGAYELCVIASATPAGFLRTIRARHLMEDNDEVSWHKGSTLKNGDNLFIMDETYLRHHLGDDEASVQAYLEQSNEMKEA